MRTICHIYFFLHKLDPNIQAVTTGEANVNMSSTIGGMFEEEPCAPCAEAASTEGGMFGGAIGGILGGGSGCSVTQIVMAILIVVLLVVAVYFMWQQCSDTPKCRKYMRKMGIPEDKKGEKEGYRSWVGRDLPMY